MITNIVINDFVRNQSKKSFSLIAAPSDSWNVVIIFLGIDLNYLKSLIRYINISVTNTMIDYISVKNTIKFIHISD